MELQDKVERTVENLHNLTVEVTALTGVVKNHEHRYGNIEKSIEAMALGIKEITLQLGGVNSLAKDVSATEKTIAEMKGDIRVNKHDIGNLQHAIALLPLLKDDLNAVKSKTEATEVRIGALETRNIKQDGGLTALKVFWMIFGSAIIGLVGWLGLTIAQGYHLSAVPQTEIQR